ncbi:2'-5'-oligoadenylate synthase 1-like [Moschus berezovskii]|uniref:2'-5'-oligoadenylate synthase 1-like n=1 Tax=Moschus berezovskii TaxID=68408 RepID=UPI002444E659|nr:2'-5'-oligoadenylate synthase 1-like [Moschus berezovskii]
METHKLHCENLEERNVKYMATKISKTCSMCSRRFGTALSREKHEIQEHRFPAHKRGLKLHLYRKLYLCKDSDEAQLCALALVRYQVDFVKASVVRVKELIRLMIHWLRTSFASPTEENKFRRLPSSYPVELLTTRIWEQEEKHLSFSLVQGMRAVLKLLVHYADIDVVWHRHYHHKFPIFVKVNQKRTRPFILDPVNPTVNVCDSCNAWDEVAHVAKLSLQKPLQWSESCAPLAFHRCLVNWVRSYLLSLHFYGEVKRLQNILPRRTLWMKGNVKKII